MIKIIPTTDKKIIEDIVNHPDILPGAIDGGGKFIYQPSDTDHFALAVYSGILCGIGRFTEIKKGSFECHAMFYKEWRGQVAVDMTRASYEWLFNTLKANCIISYASDEHRHGGVFCRAVGLKRVGIIHDFFVSNGVCYDATMYSATREDLGYGRR